MTKATPIKLWSEIEDSTAENLNGGKGWSKGFIIRYAPPKRSSSTRAPRSTPAPATPAPTTPANTTTTTTNNFFIRETVPGSTTTVNGVTTVIPAGFRDTPVNVPAGAQLGRTTTTTSSSSNTTFF